MRTVREERAFSQAELARVSKVARATIVGAEQGKPVHLRTIRKLARVLGVNPTELAAPAANGAAEGP